MSNDGISAVHDNGVVAALVEHSHVNAHYGSVEHVSLERALVRAYYHEVILVNNEVGEISEHRLEHLIRRHYVIKTHQRNCIAYSRVVSVNGDNVGNAHSLELLKRYCAIEGLTIASSVLASAVKQRHDHIDTVGLSACRLDNSHQIHVVIVGGHAVLLVEELILAAIVSYVYKDKQILAADGAPDKSLGVAGLETRALALDHVIVVGHAVTVCPSLEVTVDLCAQLLGAVHADKSKRSNGIVVLI